MSATIPDLWSDDIEVNLVSPVAILRAQTGFLERKTQGILRAEVRSTDSGNRAVHSLDLIAPALNDYRKSLLSASHAKDMIYPVTVRSEGLSPADQGLLPIPVSGSDQKTVSSQAELIEVVRRVLRSGYVRSLIHSLIARSNEASIIEPDRNGSTQMQPPQPGAGDHPAPPDG